MSAAGRWIARCIDRLENSPVGDAIGAASVLVIYVGVIVLTAGASVCAGQA